MTPSNHGNESVEHVIELSKTLNGINEHTLHTFSNAINIKLPTGYTCQVARGQYAA